MDVSCTRCASRNPSAGVWLDMIDTCFTGPADWNNFLDCSATSTPKCVDKATGTTGTCNQTCVQCRTDSHCTSPLKCDNTLVTGSFRCCGGENIAVGVTGCCLPGYEPNAYIANPTNVRCCIIDTASLIYYNDGTTCRQTNMCSPVGSTDNMVWPPADCCGSYSDPVYGVGNWTVSRVVLE